MAHNHHQWGDDMEEIEMISDQSQKNEPILIEDKMFSIYARRARIGGSITY